MKTEVSAGGIVVKKSPTGWDVLICQDRNDAWTFPKGKIERGESVEETARREIGEEVGVTDLDLIDRLPTVHYFYTRNGRVSKTVHYFLFISQGLEALVNQQEEGIHDAQWMPFEKVMGCIGYPKTNTPLLEEAKKTLATHQ